MIFFMFIRKWSLSLGFYFSRSAAKISGMCFISSALMNSFQSMVFFCSVVMKIWLPAPHDFLQFSALLVLEDRVPQWHVLDGGATFPPHPPAECSHHKMR